MNFHTTKGGQNLTELARTLYKPESTRTPEADLKAVAALREANPQLPKDKVVPAGTMIMVPEVPGYHYRPVSDPAQELAAAAARQLREVLGRLGDVLGSAVADQEKNEQETTRQLEKMTKDKVVLVPGKRIADRLKSIKGATKERAKALADQRTVQEQGIAQLGKDLAAFLQIHDR